MEIFEYIKNNNLLELKKYLQFGNVNIVDHNNKSLLHYAVDNHSIDCINLLIDNFIDLNIQDNNNQTPLFEAALKGKLGVVKLLVQNDCNVNIQDEYGNIALFYAIQTNNIAIVDLLTIYSDLSIRNFKEENALFIAIKFNYYDIDKFINESSIINSNYQNDSILHYACKYNNIDIIKKYCDRFYINKKNHLNETVFFYAIKYSNREIVRYLINYLPCIDITNKYSEKLIDIYKMSFYKIEDLLENYISSLEFIEYKKINKHIYNYLCNNEINNISNILLNKKDSFSLSLVDYIKFNDDKELLKKLIK